jgi:hypothetical protein
MDDKDKERIKFHTEILRLCVVILLTCGGGSIKMVLDGDIIGGKGFLVAMGVLISVTCLVHGYKSVKYIIKLNS